MQQIVDISFHNTTRPDAGFDIVTIEEILVREQLDHSPFDLHKVTFYIILFFTEARGYHTIDFTDYAIKNGTVLTVRKDQIHKFHRVGDTKGMCLLFTDEFLRGYLEQNESLKTLQLFNELLGSPKLDLNTPQHTIIEQIIQRLSEEYIEQQDEFALPIIRSELQVLISKLFRIKSKRDNIIVTKKYLSEFIQFQSFVEDHVRQTTRVHDYADMMAVSTKTLNNITKTIIHKSAKDFIDEISIIQIKRQLIHSTLTIKEIAYNYNFEETSNFYKYFKRNVGMTPEQYRSAM